MNFRLGLLLGFLCSPRAMRAPVRMFQNFLALLARLARSVRRAVVVGLPLALGLDQSNCAIARIRVSLGAHLAVLARLCRSPRIFCSPISCDRVSQKVPLFPILSRSFGAAFFIFSDRELEPSTDSKGFVEGLISFSELLPSSLSNQIKVLK